PPLRRLCYLFCCPLGSALFPYTTLFRSVRRACRARDVLALAEEEVVDAVDLVPFAEQTRKKVRSDEPGGAGDDDPHLPSSAARVDRKSTRLNSSHVSNSYAVFCLKKKNH